MHFYFVTNWNESVIYVADTFNDVKKFARTTAWDSLRVKLHDIPTTKEDIHKMLLMIYTGTDESLVLGKPLRVWDVTSRGGLKERDVGDD